MRLSSSVPSWLSWQPVEVDAAAVAVVVVTVVSSVVVTEVAIVAAAVGVVWCWELLLCWEVLYGVSWCSVVWRIIVL